MNVLKATAALCEDRELDPELLSLLSYTLEQQQEKKEIRRRRSDVRVMKTLAQRMRHKTAGSLFQIRIGVWDKPILLLTNATNYLWFLVCPHILRLVWIADLPAVFAVVLSRVSTLYCCPAQ